MLPIYIVGAGGLGKEVYILIEDINSKSPTYEIKGFVDADTSMKQVRIGKRVIEVFEEQKFIEENRQNIDIHLAIAIGTPFSIKNLSTFYKENTKFIYPNLIHPTVQYRKDALEIIEGNIIAANSILSVDVKFDSFNFINLNCTIGHDSTIGSYNVFNPGVNLSGGLKVGNNNLFGTNSTILQYLKIGSNNTISAASFVSKDVDNNLILVGNPARIISFNKQ
jgi:sugar O-acyltransferase (sialic acid O-acetyltransferase NeuD family)